MDYQLDMSMMFAMHDALRRELAQVRRVASVRDDNPGPLLRAALGWELFKKFLTIHHQAEDDVLWPPLRARLAGQPDRVALADALEAEHEVIEPLLAAIDAAAADPGYGYQRLGDLIDELSAGLTAHLAHEEADGLPLIDASLTAAEWAHFARVHGERNLPDAARYMPWLLSQAPPRVLGEILGKFPPPLLTAYREQWAPAYAGLEIWPASAEAEPEAGPRAEPPAESEAGPRAEPAAEPAAAGHDR
jgi:Hemerythrin HHE cation binding domain